MVTYRICREMPTNGFATVRHTYSVISSAYINCKGLHRVKVHSKTGEEGHPCKSTTCHCWPHFNGTGEFMNYIYGHYTHHLAIFVPTILATVSDLVRCFLHKFNIQTPADLNIWTVYITLKVGRNPPPVVHSNPFSTSMGNRLEFSSGN
jgi:hypothetical protein